MHYKKQNIVNDKLKELNSLYKDLLKNFEKEYPEDKRPRQAIEMKRKWLRGEATDKELGAAAESAAAAAHWADTPAGHAALQGASTS